MKETGFDPLDKELREALACDAVPSADFTDKVMAQAAATPQESARPAASYKRWLMTAAACLVIAAMAVPLLQGGASNRADGAAADTAGNETAMPYADEDILQENTSLTTMPTEAKQREDSGDDLTFSGDGEAPLSAESVAMAEHLESAEALLVQRGYTLEIVACTDTAVQVVVVEEDNGAALALYDAMRASGFVEQDGWYTLAAEVAS